jgi:hypothetical protein
VPFNTVDLPALADHALDLARRHARLLGAAAAPLERAALSTRAAETVVVFGGHFKSGKSSLLNRVLGRAVLPAGDLPETGVACWVRRGLADRARIVDTDGKARGEIPPTPAAISQFTSLVTADGRRRGSRDLPARLEIELAENVPPGFVYVDSPGINDEHDMDEAAWAAAGAGDLLLWVLSSKQCLSQPEIPFLERFVAARGPAVLLALNAFLPRQEGAAWRRFLDQHLPIHEDRLARELGALGLTDTSHHVLTVSAEPVSATPDLGLSEFKRALAYVGQDGPRRALRLIRLRAAASQAASAMAPTHDAARTSHEAATAQHMAKLAARETFSQAASTAFDGSLARLKTSVTAAAGDMARGISSSVLSRDSTYGTKLTGAFRDARKEQLDELFETLDRAARRACGSALGVREREALAGLLDPGEIKVEVPNIDPSGGAVLAGAAAGAAAGSFIPVLGTIFGGLIGAAVAAVSSGSDAVDKDVAGAKSNVEAAAKKALESVVARKAQFVAAAVEHCLGATPPSLPAPDSRLKELDDLRSGLVRLEGPVELPFRALRRAQSVGVT